MKKLKLLRAGIALCILQSAGFYIASIVFIIKMAPYKHANGAAYLATVTMIMQALKYILPMPALVLLFLALHYFVKRGYFNAKSARRLKWAGIILMISSLIEYFAVRLTWKVMKYSFIPDKSFALTWLDGLPLLLMYLVLGFALYTLSDFITRGEAIETENKLTI